MRRARLVLSMLLILNQILNILFTYKSAMPLYLLIVLNAVPVICDGLMKNETTEDIMPAVSRKYRYNNNTYRNNMIAFIMCCLMLLLLVIQMNGYRSWLETLPLFDLIAAVFTYLGCTTYYRVKIRNELLP